MASGKVHAGQSFGAAAVLLALGVVLLDPPADAVALASGCAAGILISPDLDVDGWSYSERVLGRFFGSIWLIIWYPYAKIIPHRNPLSHAPLIGTAGRVLYLGAIVYLFQLLIEFSLPPSANFYIPLAIVGLSISDTLHWMADLR